MENLNNLGNSLKSLNIYDNLDNQNYSEQIKNEIQLLKIQNENLSIQNQNLILENERLEKTIGMYKNTPAIIGSVSEIFLDKMKVVIRTNNGMIFFVNLPERFLKEIQIESRVVLAQNNLAMLDVLSPEKDYRAQAFEINEKPKISFKEVGGLKKVILEVEETVILPLTKPELFIKFGIDSPKGILLYGPPGTGKTMLVKAIAQKTKSTMISLNGSELVHKFIGEGAKVVKDLFKIAKEKAPTIIFIDELDAVASYRMDISTGADREVNRTLTQLLVEMDGFYESDQIKVIAATNRKDILDDAILRPGRFDRVIEISLPSYEDRIEIFNIYLKKIPHSNVNLKDLANKTKDCSGADIKLICKEAAMFAIRKNLNKITQLELNEAINKIKKPEIVEKETKSNYYR